MQRIKIGILAPQLMKNHISYYKAIIELFMAKNCQLTVFAHIELTNELSILYPNISYIPKKHNNSFYGFFRSIRKQANKLDLLLIEQSYGITLSYILGFNGVNCKKLYTVHNVNSWLAPTFSLKLKAIATNLSHKFIIKKAEGVVVVGSNLKNFITKLQLIGNKPVFYLPFSLPTVKDKIEIEKNNQIVLLVVPGTINPIRRDYISLLNAFEKAIQGGTSNIHLVLLGKPDYEIEGTSLIINKINKIKSLDANSIIFWDEYIPSSEFSYYLQQADFIISNINIFYPYSENYEIYGITKETGISTLMCEYKKPSIIIGDFMPPDELKDHVNRCGVSEPEILDMFIKLSKKEIVSSQYIANYDEALKKIELRIEKEVNQLLDFIVKQ